MITISKITKDLIWYKPVETTTDTSTTTTTETETTTGTTVISEELKKELDDIKKTDINDLSDAEKETLIENVDTGKVDPTKLKDQTVTEIVAREEAIKREAEKEKQRIEDLYKNINEARKKEGLPPLSKEEFLARQQKRKPKPPVDPENPTTGPPQTGEDG